MKATDREVGEALRARRAPNDRSACPSAEDLARAAARASGPAAEALIDHVAGCPDCAFEYRLAAAVEPWAEGAAAYLIGGPRRSLTSRSLPVALAACLVVSLGLIGWVLVLRQQTGRLETRVAEAEHSRQRAEDEAARRQHALDRELNTLKREAAFAGAADVPLVDLFPHDAARGPGSAFPIVDASRGPFVVFILNVRQPEPGAAHAVEIQDAEGIRVWAAERVPAGREPLTLAIPTRLLSGESYKIRLHRVRGERRILAEQYAFRVARRERGSPP